MFNRKLKQELIDFLNETNEPTEFEVTEQRVEEATE